MNYVAVEQWSARLVHTQEVGGSNPPRATRTRARGGKTRATSLLELPRPLSSSLRPGAFPGFGERRRGAVLSAVGSCKAIPSLELSCITFGCAVA